MGLQLKGKHTNHYTNELKPCIHKWGIRVLLSRSWLVIDCEFLCTPLVNDFKICVQVMEMFTH